MHFQDSSGPGWCWPEFRGHKPLEKGAIRQWGHLTLMWSEGRFQSCINYLLMLPQGRALCSKLRLCWAQERGWSPPSQGWCGQVCNSVPSYYTGKEADGQPLLFPGHWLPKSPSLGTSMAMRTWAGEGEGGRSEPLVCLVLSSPVSPLALPLFVSNGTLERASPGPFQCPTEFQAPLRSAWCFQC